MGQLALAVETTCWTSSGSYGVFFMSGNGCTAEGRGLELTMTKSISSSSCASVVVAGGFRFGFFGSGLKVDA